MMILFFAEVLLPLLLLLHVVAVARVSSFQPSCTSTPTSTSSRYRYNYGISVSQLPSEVQHQQQQQRQQKQQHSSWMQQARQLYEYQKLHGHTNVPKRSLEHPSLANWVSKQRQEYKRYHHHDRISQPSCALTERRIAILEQMGFVWDAAAASSSINNNTKTNNNNQDEQVIIWWTRFKEVKEYVREHEYSKLAYLPRQTRMGLWLDRQRRRYLTHQHQHQQTQSATASSSSSSLNNLTQDQLDALTQLDPDWWMTRRQWQWELRFRQLCEYAEAHKGDCCVPISYAANQSLAHWVSTQRKQYKKQNRNNNNASSSDYWTDYRWQRLNAIGFVWNAAQQRDQHWDDDA